MFSWVKFRNGSSFFSGEKLKKRNVGKSWIPSLYSLSLSLLCLRMSEKFEWRRERAGPLQTWDSSKCKLAADQQAALGYAIIINSAKIVLIQSYKIDSIRAIGVIVWGRNQFQKRKHNQIGTISLANLVPTVYLYLL